jgi:hypothetical protein
MPVRSLVNVDQTSLEIGHSIVTEGVLSRLLEGVRRENSETTI